MTTKEQFIEMAKGITRPGIDQMMAWLETTDFYTAPASTRFHGAEEGGLCAHSITVAKRLLEIADLWAPNQYSRDTLLTVALFHDLCKVFTYPVSTRNVKDKTTGRWKEVPYYDFKPKESVGGNNHGDLSCYRITATGMPLSMEEYAAVNNHMGVSNEMSMVGEHLFAYAIDAVLSSPSTRIVLLGDTDQLAPVARGDVLRDLIKCGVIKTVRLDVNYRQGSTSTITDASIKIRENRAYTGNTRNLMFDDEFRFVPVAEKDKEKEANEIMNHIVEEYLNGVSKYGMEGTIVLTPTHYDKGTPSGYLCKNRVNAAIQAIVNPKTDDKLCVEIGKQLFMVGDRIIQRKNTEQVINGDLGTIQSIARLESDVAVEIYFDSKGETLVYNNEDMKDIELAYAITVHSSQGCEFPCCIIPVSMTYGVMLTKPLYYTGITRAKKKLVMIGDEEALKYALQNFRKQTRKSLLGPRIITKLKKAKT